MIKATIRLVATVAAASLAFAPIAASANTRAGDSDTSYTAAASQPGQGRDATGEKLIAPGILGAILAAAAAAGIIIIIDDDDNQSPGGN